MKFTEFCLKRPVFATILNLMILIIGILSYDRLTIREYPDVTTPTMTVQVIFPNASPEVVEKEVTSVLEEALAGLEGLETIQSSSSYNSSSVTLKFKPTVRMADAQSDIRENLGTIRQILPEDAEDPIVSPDNQSGEAFFYLTLSGDGYSFADLNHMAKLHLKDPLKTIKGVSQVEIHGDDYSMMVELDRNKLLQYDLDAVKVYAKLREQNISLPAGRYQGRIPINFDLNLKTEEDFRSLPLADRKGKIITLGDVATIKLGSTRSNINRVNGKPSVMLGLIKSSEGNPLEIAKTIYSRMDEYRRHLPADVQLEVSFDKTKFIEGSLNAIQKSILEAIVLVIIIVFLFLRSGRSTLIPIITIPLSLVGVMGLMALFGLSINTITLLAMVLAVGLVVDDAIVVLENIHRHVEEGLSPLQAAFKGVQEIGFAIIAMTFTLAAAYAPVAFMQDTIGQVFFEFAVTLAGAVILSGLIALTFSPLMCAKLLNREKSEKLAWFDRFLDKLTHRYKSILSTVLTWPKMTVLGCIGALGACAYLYTALPKMITPLEDRGVVGVWIPHVAGTSLGEFDAYVKRAEKVFKDVPEAPHYLTLSMGDNGNIIAVLVDWSKRNRRAEDIVHDLRQKVKSLYTAEAYPWSWDSGIPGVEPVSSSDGGVGVILKTTGSYEYLSQQANKLKNALETSDLFADARHDLKLSYPSLKAKVDRRTFQLTGLKPEDVATTIAMMMDQNINLEFKKDGIRYPIALINRVEPIHLEELYLLNQDNIRIPLSSFIQLERAALPKALQHHNKMRSTQISATLNKDVDVGAATDFIIQKAAETLPPDVHLDFTGAAKKLKESSTTMLFLIFVSMLFIYCILAIQFESFIDPLIIMFTVPLAGFGALLLVRLTGGSVNIFTQVGLITLMGLITKHGILIVEFANQRLRSTNCSPQQAVREAAGIRLRPILMTTGAMVFGSLPLIFSSGAGAEARQAIGYVLVGGLSLGTILTLFVIPVVYEIIKGMGHKATENL